MVAGVDLNPGLALHMALPKLGIATVVPIGVAQSPEGRLSGANDPPGFLILGPKRISPKGILLNAFAFSERLKTERHEKSGLDPFTGD